MEDGTGRSIDFKNTLIILTSNVGTDTIVEASADPHYQENVEALATAIRSDLLQVFPPRFWAARDDPLFSSVARGTGWHRAAPARSYWQAHSREPRRDFRLRRSRRPTYCLALQ